MPVLLAQSRQAYTRLYNAAASPASRLRSAGSLATTKMSIISRVTSGERISGISKENHVSLAT